MEDNQRETVGYAAGLIDGEGYISLSKQKPNGLNKTPRYQVKVGIKMCSEQVIRFMHINFGGGVYQRAPYKTHWKGYWEWHLNTGKSVKDFLLLVLPFLIEKQERAKLMIEYIESLSGRTSPVSNEELLRREAYFMKMKSLNTRGVPATTNWEDA